MSDVYRILQCEGLNFGFWITKSNQLEHSGYHPQHVLFNILKGTLNLRIADQTFHFESGSMLLVKKHFMGYYSKSWTVEEAHSEVQAIVFQDEFLKDILEEIEAPTESQGELELKAFFEIAPNQILTSLFSELKSLFPDTDSIELAKAHQKTKQAIMGLLKENPKLIHIFTWITDQSRASLPAFVDHHYLSGKSIEELAYLSGRSLSTFYREFHKEYGESPSKWVMKRRMIHAYELVKNTDQTLTEIAYSCGFQDLSHFSKRFKKYFNSSPSSLRRK